MARIKKKELQIGDKLIVSKSGKTGGQFSDVIDSVTLWQGESNMLQGMFVANKGVKLEVASLPKKIDGINTIQVCVENDTEVYTTYWCHIWVTCDKI